MARLTGFVFQDEYLAMLAKLSDQEVGRLVRALATYHATGEAQELAGRESIAFDFIKVDIDRIDKKYEDRCETNRNNREGSSTNDNDRQRPSTTNNDREQVIVIEKDSEEKNKEKVKRESRRFTPPARDEVAAYIAEKGYRVDPDRWMAYYESNGWRVGKNPMKDWKAAVRTWATNGVDAKPAQKVPAQNDYAQRTYEERKPNKLPQWLQDMVDSGEAVV